MLLIFNYSYSQNIGDSLYPEVQGKVFNEKNEVVKGVTIKNSDGKIIAISDTNGIFILRKVLKNSIIEVVSLGYISEHIKVSIVNLIIKLTAIPNDLNEVIVVGYGTQKKKDLTGPVSHIGEDDFKDRPLTGIDQAMVAKMPGVQVQAIDGTPGAALQIRVRGSSSISSSNDPLYIVDGVPVENLQDIDPNVVESIDVLKDASTASIYGARGSNGVVLITTKKGKQGKPRYSFKTNIARSTPERLVKMMDVDEWIQFKKDLIDSNWVKQNRSVNLASDDMNLRAQRLSTTAFPVYNTHLGSNVNYMYDPYWQYGSDSLDIVDWQDAFYRPAYLERANLNISGSNSNVTYMLSGDYTNQTGMAPNSSFQLYNLRSNVEVKLSNNTKLGFNLAPSFSRRIGQNVAGRSGIGASVAGMPLIQEKGVGSNAGEVGENTYRWVSDIISPIYAMENTLNNTQLTKIMSNVYLDFNIAKGLNLRTTGAWNSSSSDYKGYTPTSVSTSRKTAAPGSLSRAYRNTNRSQYYLFQAVATYNFNLGQNKFNIIAGSSIEQTYASSTGQTASGFANDNLYTFNNATSANVVNSTTFETQRRQNSMFGRVNYSFSDRYLASFSVRRDGISRFINNKFGTFPAASLAWRLSNEKFLHFLRPVINDWKIRYAWGKVGNDRIGSSDYPSEGVLGASSYPFNNTVNTGFAQNVISTPNLKWEKTTTHDIGTDISFLNNRISLTFDYYIKTTNDLLLAATVPSVTGFYVENKNIGSVRNQGYEINLNTTNIDHDKFSWQTSFNFSFNKNKVLKLINGDAPIYTGFDNTVRIAVGQPIYSYYLFNSIGVYTTQEKFNTLPKMSTNIIGDPIYEDVNKDGIINNDDKTDIGHPDPNYTWGMTNNLTIGKFNISLLFQGQWGNKIFSLFGRNIDRPSTSLGSYNIMKKWATRFRSLDSPGDGINPRIDASTASLYDSRWIYDGAFYKVKNLTVGYNMGQPKFLKAIKSMNVYISVENLWMHSNYDGGYSPEAFQYTYLSDWSSFPTARTYSAGININF